MAMRLKPEAMQACLLVLVEQGEGTPYALATTLVRALGVAEGASYPVLRGMLADDWISSYLVELDDGPPRKYYRMEVCGREALARLRAQHGEVLQQLLTGMQGEGYRLDEASRRTGQGRDSFLVTLRQALQGLPAPMQKEIVADYSSHFADAALEGRSEQAVSGALGDPRELALALLARAPSKRRGLGEAAPESSVDLFAGALVSIASVFAFAFGIFAFAVMQLCATATMLIGVAVMIMEIPGLGLAHLVTIDIAGHVVQNTTHLLATGCVLVVSGALWMLVNRAAIRGMRGGLRNHFRNAALGFRAR